MANEPDELCECCACGCCEPATTTADGAALCDACSLYLVTDDGDVRCSRCDDVDVTTDSYGRDLVRIRPPAEPAPDPTGEYACYWHSLGDEGRVISRHATAESAEQAVAAQDWPPPGDTGRYLCGYQVRYLNNGSWRELDCDED